MRDVGSPQRHLRQPGAHRRRGSDRRRRGADRQVPPGLLSRPARSAAGSCGMSSAVPARSLMSIGEVLQTLRRRLPGRHHLQDPVPRVRGPRRAGAHAVGLPQVQPPGRRAAALRAVRPARPVPAAAGHQGAPRRDRPRPARCPLGAARTRASTRRRRRQQRDPALAQRADRGGRHRRRPAGADRELRPGRAGGPGRRTTTATPWWWPRPSRRCAAYGLEPRHLRAFRTGAEREAGLVEQVVAPAAAPARPGGPGPRRGGGPGDGSALGAAAHRAGPNCPARRSSQR